LLLFIANNVYLKHKKGKKINLNLPDDEAKHISALEKNLHSLQKMKNEQNSGRCFVLSFTFYFQTTQSLPAGDPCCSLQIGFAHFEYRELVFFSKII